MYPFALRWKSPATTASSAPAIVLAVGQEVAAKLKPVQSCRLLRRANLIALRIVYPNKDDVASRALAVPLSQPEPVIHLGAFSIIRQARHELRQVVEPGDPDPLAAARPGPNLAESWSCILSKERIAGLADLPQIEVIRTAATIVTNEVPKRKHPDVSFVGSQGGAGSFEMQARSPPLDSTRSTAFANAAGALQPPFRGELTISATV